MTRFQCRDRNRLGFVRGSKMTWFRVSRVEINLVFVSGEMDFRVGGVQN